MESSSFIFSSASLLNGGQLSEGKNLLPKEQNFPLSRTYLERALGLREANRKSQKLFPFAKVYTYPLSIA